MKEFACKTVMPNCNAVIQGKDMQEVMTKATEHAKKAHGMQNITPEIRQKVQAAIHDV
jgi:predicted small metal-binding protein